MKILFLSVGKKHDPELVNAIDDFTSRISKYAPVEWRFIAPRENIEKEGEAVIEVFGDRDYVILLDEKGKEITSVGLSDTLEKRLNESTHRLVFVIGGAFGASEALKQRVNSIVSLSKMTFPHQIVRLVLAEQVYRAFTIGRGEKYHHS